MDNRVGNTGGAACWQPGWQAGVVTNSQGCLKLAPHPCVWAKLGRSTVSCAASRLQRAHVPSMLQMAWALHSASWQPLESRFLGLARCSGSSL